MSESLLDPAGKDDQPMNWRHGIEPPSDWPSPGPPPPLNFSHLRVVASGDSTSHPGEATPAYEEPPAAADDAVRIRQLEQELTEARNQAEALQDEAEALHQMLEDLPEIFERKFRQRLQAVLDHQQRLLADNQALREHLFALGPAAAVERPRLPPANEERWGLGRRLRHILRHDRGT
jgi:hypothetical protein